MAIFLGVRSDKKDTLNVEEYIELYRACGTRSSSSCCVLVFVDDSSANTNASRQGGAAIAWRNGDRRLLHGPLALDRGLKAAIVSRRCVCDVMLMCRIQADVALRVAYDTAVLAV